MIVLNYNSLKINNCGMHEFYGIQGENFYLFFWRISDICLSSKKVWSNTKFELTENLKN